MRRGIVWNKTDQTRCRIPPRIPFVSALAKFWAPVPCLLEAAILLDVVLHRDLEAAVIAVLLVFNAALAWFQEGRAQATLAALKSRLALNASVRRDGVWKTVPASELVRGDLVKLSLGGEVAADVHLIGGPSCSIGR
jgi:H+-transporting ATPase